MAQPRIEHLQQAVNILYYLKHNINKGWLIFDPLDFDPVRPNEMSPQGRAKLMKLLYHDAEETIPHDMSQHRGKSVNINIFADADHACDLITRRSFFRNHDLH